LHTNGVKIIKLFLMRGFLLAFLILLASGSLHGQTRSVKKAIRQSEQQEKKEKKDYDRRRKAALKHRYSIQSKEVQERMKESKKKADRFNKGSKEPFYRGLFKKKKKKRRKRRPR